MTAAELCSVLPTSPPPRLALPAGQLMGPGLPSLNPYMVTVSPPHPRPECELLRGDPSAPNPDPPRWWTRSFHRQCMSSHCAPALLRGLTHVHERTQHTPCLPPILGGERQCAGTRANKVSRARGERAGGGLSTWECGFGVTPEAQNRLPQEGDS